jgi:hypothetical protein
MLIKQAMTEGSLATRMALVTNLELGGLEV